MRHQRAKQLLVALALLGVGMAGVGKPIWFSAPGWVLIVLGFVLTEGWINTSKVFDPPTIGWYWDTQHPKDSERAIVFLPGLANESFYTAFHLSATMREFGDVVLVDYPKGRIYECMLLLRLDQELSKYREVVLVGYSFGGTMIIRLLRYLRKFNAGAIDRIRGVVLVDTPTCKQDVKPPMIRLAHHINAGWVLSRLWPGLQWLFLTVMGKPYTEDGHDKSHLRDHVRAMRRYPASGYIDQARLIVDTKRPEPREFAGIHAVIVDCIGSDGLVKDSAHNTLMAAFPRHFEVRGARGHACPCEEPVANDLAIRESLEHLLTSSPR